MEVSEVSPVSMLDTPNGTEMQKVIDLCVFIGLV